MSEKEGIALVVNLLCSKLFLLTPLIFTKNSGSGALINVVFVFILAFLSFYVCSKYKLTKNKIFSCAVLISVLFCTVSSLSLVVYYTKSMVLTRSPLAFITLLYAVCMLIPTLCGLKSIAKIHGFFVPIVYICLAILLFFSAKSFNYTNIFPIFGKGFSKIFLNGFFLLSMLFETVLLLFISEKTNGSVQKVGIASLSISLILYLGVIFSYIAIGEYGTALPIFSIIQNGIFGRGDSGLILLFTISNMLYLSAMLYFATEIFTETFSIQQNRNLNCAFLLFVTGLSGISFFSPEGQQILRLASFILWAVAFLIPLVFKGGKKLD